MKGIQYKKDQKISEDKAQIDIHVTVQPEEYARIWEQEAQKYAQTVSMPGFRKGKVPINTVKTSKYNEISELAFNTMVQQVVQDVSASSEYRPVSTIRIDMDAHDHESHAGEEHDHNSIEFALSYSYRISPKLPDISTISLPRPDSNVTDEEIKQSMDMLLDSLKQAETEEITGEYEWDDAKVEKLGVKDVKTVDELMQLVRKEIERQKKYEQEVSYRSQILDEIVKKSELVLPQYVVEDTIVQQERYYRERIEKLGFEYDKYIEDKKVDMDALRKEWEQMITEDLARELVLSQYVNDYKIEPSEDEIDQAINNAEKELKDKYEPDALRQYMKYVLSNNIAFSKIYAEVGQE